MDPNANLRHQEWLINQIDVCRGPNRKKNLEAELSESRQALYDWVRDGGFEPNWKVAPIAATYFIGSREKTMKNRKQTAKTLREGNVVNKPTAENNAGSNAENALLPEGNQEESVLSDPPFTNRREGFMEITVQFKGTQKNGIHTYSDNTRGASIYVNKSMFGGNPPESLVVSAPDGTFSEAGAARSPRGASPERVAKAAEKAQKAAERAQKAQERATKAQELAARLAKAQGGAAAEQPSA